MRINLKDLWSGLKSSVDFDYTIDLSKEEVNFEYPFKKPVELSGRISDMAGVLSLTATIEAEVTSACARCSKPVTYQKEVFCDFVLMQEDDGTADEGDGVFVTGDEVDLDEILIPELILDMELVVLCKEDCRGLCPKCGQDLNAGECSCDKSTGNKPFADLAKLLQNN